MTQNKSYNESDFIDTGKTQTTPSNKKKAGAIGLSVTRLGRLSLTTQLQKDMKIDPKDRTTITYVKVQQHKATEGYDRYTFLLKFYDNENEYPDEEQRYKLYKPDRRKKFKTPNDTSYFEFARFLKEKNIIESVGELKVKEIIKAGGVEILKRDTATRTLIINLSERIENQE